MDDRLRLIAACIRPGGVVADIGADHAYLCLWLAGQGICRRAIATELRPGPAASARANVARQGMDALIEVRLGDGLGPVAPGEADDIVIAGMGGETIAAILAAAAWVRDGRYRLVLQPMSRPEALRAWLGEAGFALEREEAAAVGKRLYTVMVAAYDPAAAARQRTPAGVYRGALDPRDKLARRWLEGQRKRLLRAADGLADSGHEEEAAAMRGTAALVGGPPGEEGP